jgi:hypothetical protein
MSLTARLHIEGHSNEQQGIPVLACDFSFSQDTDGRGMATSAIRGGVINVMLRGIDDPDIIQWMIGHDVLKNGRIAFSGITSTGPGRRIEFEDGFLVSYHESFTNESDITINLVISCRLLTISGVSHENQWTRSTH